MLSGGTIRELEITGGNLKSLVKDRYCEEDFASKVDPFFTGGQTEVLTEDNDPFWLIIFKEVITYQTLLWCKVEVLRSYRLYTLFIHYFA